MGNQIFDENFFSVLEISKYQYNINSEKNHYRKSFPVLMVGASLFAKVLSRLHEEYIAFCYRIKSQKRNNTIF